MKLKSKNEIQSDECSKASYLNHIITGFFHCSDFCYFRFYCFAQIPCLGANVSLDGLLVITFILYVILKGCWWGGGVLTFLQCWFTGHYMGWCSVNSFHETAWASCVLLSSVTMRAFTGHSWPASHSSCRVRPFVRLLHSPAVLQNNAGNCGEKSSVGSPCSNEHCVAHISPIGGPKPEPPVKLSLTPIFFLSWAAL